MIGFSFLGVILLIALGVAVAYSFGGATFAYYAVEGGNLTQVVSVAFRTIDSFTFLAIPFFLLAGSIMQHAGITKRLVDFVAIFTGRVRGGMAATVVGACALFGAISGSSVATVSAVGRIMTEGMVERGYTRSFVGSLVGVSGILGILIPPSVPMIVYGTAAGVSIGDMFLAGVSSGVIMAILLIINVLVLARRQPSLNDRGFKGVEDESSGGGGTITKTRKRLSLMPAGKLVAAVPAILTPVIILGGIYSGLLTPTESGAMACVYALFIGLLVYRELKPSDLGKTFLDGLLATAPILLIIAFGGAFARALLLSGLPQQISSFVAGLDVPNWGIILILNLFLFAIGMFIEENTAIVILVPLLMPVAEVVGLGPIQFGVIMVLNLGIGLVTPPFSPNLFVASSACGVAFHKIVFPALRFIAFSALPTLILVNFFPILSTWFV